MRILLSLLFAATCFGQTTVYLRSSGPAGFDVVGATSGTPVVIQTNVAHGINTGDKVVIWGLCGPTSANGIRIATYVDATHFSIADTSNNPIVGNGAYCNG